MIKEDYLGFKELTSFLFLTISFFFLLFMIAIYC